MQATIFSDAAVEMLAVMTREAVILQMGTADTHVRESPEYLHQHKTALRVIQDVVSEYAEYVRCIEEKSL